MARAYEIVLYGATGFTGRLAAKYIVQNCPNDLKWAIAGRSQPKLTALANEIKDLNIDRKPAAIIVADSDDFEALTSLAQSTKVVISVAGPFAQLGNKVVQACAENGTHYADITGETPWVYQIIKKYHEKPTSSPSILVPSCGLDSLPSDLGTSLLIAAIQKKYGENVKIKNVRAAVQELKGKVSGGTIESGLYLMEAFPTKEILASFRPFAFSPIGKPVNYVPQKRVVYDERLGGWLGPWMMGNTNTSIVCRTYGLLQGKWGDAFSYREYLNWGSWWLSHTVQFLTGIFMGSLVFPPIRWLVRKFVRGPGTGATDEELAAGKFVMKIIAETDEDEPRCGSITLSTDHDAGYLATAMFLVESGLVLAKDVEKTQAWKMFFEKEEKQSVVVTPGVLGDVLKTRLEKGGLNFAFDV